VKFKSVLFAGVPRILQKHYTVLTEHMDPDHGLLPHLASAGVVTARQVEDINAEPTSSKKNERIITCLRRKGHQEYDRFLQSLDKTGQTHVARCLREG